MAGRKSEPWFWEHRGEWAVTIKGKRHRLGADKAEALKKFHRMMAGDQAEEVSDRKWVYASEVADQFQVTLKEERSEATLDWYCNYLDKFKKRFLTVRADRLSADIVREWINGTWTSQASRRGATRAIKAAFRRAVTDGRLGSCPVSQMKLPPETSRDHFATREEYDKVLASVKDQTFADMIRFVWLTGCRPQEVTAVDASHVDVSRGRVVFPIKQAKGKKKPRVIYITPEASELLKERLEGGAVFKTKRGRRFTKDMVRNRFRNLEKHVGFRYCMYHFRHGFAHRALAAGNDALTVSTLMGHSSTQTLARVYAHLNQADEHLREALRKTK